MKSYNPIYCVVEHSFGKNIVNPKRIRKKEKIKRNSQSIAILTPPTNVLIAPMSKVWVKMDSITSKLSS